MKVLATDKHTDQWFTARRGRITSSGLPAVLARAGTQRRANYIDELTLDLEGIPDHNDAYPAPWETEAYAQQLAALDWYAGETGAKVYRAGFVSHSEFAWLGFSPAGFVSYDGLLHIKTRKSRRSMESRAAPGKAEIRRVQFELMISGRKWCDFISFCGLGEPAGRVTRIEPDIELQEYLEFRCHLFWQEVLQGYGLKTAERRA